MTLSVSSPKKEISRHWDTMLGRLPFPMLVMTGQGKILYASPYFLKRFGLSATPSEFNFCAPLERKKILAALRKEGFVEGYSLCISLAEGQTRWFSLSAFPLQTEQQTAFLVAMVDVTPSKQVESASTRQLARLEALYAVDQAIIGSLNLGVILTMLVEQARVLLEVDAATVLLWNETTNSLNFAARQGFTTEATKFTSLHLGEGLAGRAAQEGAIVHIPNLAAMTDNPVFAQAIAKEQFVTYLGVPLVAQKKLLGVMEIFHRSALAPAPDWLTFLQTLAGQAAIAIQNARMMETTRQSLREINALYQINQQLAASLDSAELMENVTDLLQAQFGYFYVQVLVRDPQSGDFVIRAGSGEIGRKLKQIGYRLPAGEGMVGFTAETGEPFFTNEVDANISFQRPPFLTGTQSEMAVPIRAGSQFLGLLDIHQSPPQLLTQRDLRLVSSVADQLAVALQRAAMYAELQESLRHDQENRAQLIHNEKLAVAGRLLASVSHELNNPIQAIQNALFLIKNESSLSQQARQDLEIVLAETDRMAAMLQRLRGTYLPEGYNKFTPVALNDLIDDVSMLVATHLRHSQISFEFQPDPDLPLVLGSEDQLRQVILNLVINAVDAMPSGGHLTIATQADPTRREILVSIADRGPGIAPEILPKIFEAFVTTKQHGSGLGLNICSQIIQTHHGRITAENNPQGGAIFSVWLPAAGAEAE